MSIDAKRLWNRLETLSTLTDPEHPWTRRSFSPLFNRGRAWLAEAFVAAGLETSIDAGGNLIGRRAGKQPDLPPIIIGSHSDTVPSGGRYDGILGVLAGLEIAHSLQDQAITLAHDLLIIDFLAEEPSEFGLSCIGSRAFSGSITAADLALTRPDGMTLAEGIRFVGGNPDDVASAGHGAHSTAAYLELHIEQGPILEAEGVEIGVVTAIAGIRRMRLTVIGRADHAGTTPMSMRADALVGAAKLIDLIYNNALAQTTDAQPIVATVGRIENVWPNVANAVSAKAEITLECRAGTDEEVITFCESVLRTGQSLLRSINLDVRGEIISHTLPTPCAPAFMEAFERSAAALGKRSRRLPSGAGHDGMFVSKTGPIGMVFVPCLGGRSHTPEESITPEQAADGAAVLMHTLQTLDKTLSLPPPQS